MTSPMTGSSNSLSQPLGLDLGSDDERGFRGLLDSRLRLLDIADKSVVIGKP